ncbi:MAG: nucleotide sugar dehydrogenase [Candidatus Thorarchaeota archaeon]|nr:nucleotide sugar dehydrogenase [Candidatus Thorarchaeota archaeon]
MVTKIVVIGMGYVGIPVAALLADVDGHDVTGLQRRSERSGWKIDTLNAGESPFKGVEPGLDELLHRVHTKGTFRVTDNPDVLCDADVILIDVQTPTDAQHIPQYVSLREVCHQIGKRIKRGALVVVESTVAPGTTQHVVQRIIEEESGLTAGADFGIVFSYERVMPGKLIHNIVNLPRVVGGVDPQSTERAADLYSRIVKAPIRKTTALTAEISKTIENAFRDVNIAFANEMAMVCESMGVDVYEVISLVNELPSRMMHIPGAGVGGHCLPKDPWLLRHGLYQYGDWKIEPEFISLARRINDHMPLHMAYLIENALAARGREMRNSIVTVLGVAYLENSDDTRNTPAGPLVLALQSRGVKIRLHDPYVTEWELAPTEIMKDLTEAARGSDCLVLVTKHQEYVKLNLEEVRLVMRTPIIVDGRNVFTTEAVMKHGFEYRCVGKVGAKH